MGQPADAAAEGEPDQAFAAGPGDDAAGDREAEVDLTLATNDEFAEPFELTIPPESYVAVNVSDEERVQFLTDVLSSGKHLLGLINEVLDLAKVEAGKMELQIEPALLQDVIEAVSNTMRSLAVKKSIDLRAECDEGLAPIPMDGARIKQVLLKPIQ